MSGGDAEVMLHLLSDSVFSSFPVLFIQGEFAECTESLTVKPSTSVQLSKNAYIFLWGQKITPPFTDTLSGRCSGCSLSTSLTF